MAWLLKNLPFSASSRLALRRTSVAGDLRSTRVLLHRPPWETDLTKSKEKARVRPGVKGVQAILSDQEARNRLILPAHKRNGYSLYRTLIEWVYLSLPLHELTSASTRAECKALGS